MTPLRSVHLANPMLLCLLLVKQLRRVRVRRRCAAGRQVPVQDGYISAVSSRCFVVAVRTATARCQFLLTPRFVALVSGLAATARRSSPLALWPWCALPRLAAIFG